MSKPNLPKQAQGLAALGRGPDNMLVHMSDREVASLQKMAEATGGSLTINPKTGLPEAGWLDAVLPVVAGGLASLATGGLAAPILAGGLVGYMTGDKDQPWWMRGGLGALGGMGGGNLATSLAGMGAAGSAGTAATEAALGNTSKEALRQLGQGALSQGASQGAAAIGQGAAQLGTQGGRQALMTGLGGKLGAATLAAPAVGVAMVPPRVPKGSTGRAPIFYTGPGGSPLQYMPGRYVRNSLGEASYEGRGYGPGEYGSRYPGISEEDTRNAASGGMIRMAAGGPVDPQAMPMQNVYAPGAQPAPTTVAPAPSIAAGEPMGSSGNVDQMRSYYRSLLTPQQPSAGYVPPSSQAMTDYLGRLRNQFSAPAPAAATPTSTAQTSVQNTPAASLPSNMTIPSNAVLSSVLGQSYPGTQPTSYSYNPVTKSYTGGATATAGSGVYGGLGSNMFPRLMAAGGPVYKAGGMMRGPGDGMSDNIPAVIQGGQRAALSDGEFVVPADVVSHLGNGSSGAGAKRLDKMMADVRAARTGRRIQAPKKNMGKYLPS